MNKVLVLFAHPALEKSRVNKELIKVFRDYHQFTFRDLYQIYPEFYIDVQTEQEFLLRHDVIVFHHPLYWYSIPPLLKQWIDLTLQHNWAYGPTGIFLKGKKLISCLTTGGQKEAYTREGYNHYTIPEFLRPIEQTALLCGMDYLPPLIFHGTHQMDKNKIKEARHTYLEMLEFLAFTEKMPTWDGESYLNNILKKDPI
jgi:glutathione-regulated potassium-efflux system ancillary protein KefG